MKKNKKHKIKIRKFQFHNGSIKSGSGKLLLQKAKNSFNSTMVRLKGPVSTRICKALSLFQFHNGSIKSFKACGKYITSFAFQFHNGSIKSGHLYRIVNNIIEFQFHNGSIKRKGFTTETDIET